MPSSISGPAIPRDTGFSANSSVGDKAQVLTDYVNGVDGTMVSALNLVSAGTGTALASALDYIVVLRKKVQSLETCLASGKLPNL